MNGRKIIFYIFLMGILITSQAITAENPLVDEGISYYRQENYDEAIAALKKARKADPASTLAAYYLGLTYKQIQDYKKAESHLKDAVTLTPKIKGALLELVEVLYQLGELDEAEHYIGIAEKEGIRPAQTAFLKGLVLLKDGKNIEAVEAFEEAKSLDKSLEQTADYQIGMAYLKEERYKQAKEAFKEVVILDPNSDTALFANRYMDALLKKEEEEKPFKFSLGFAYEYDDNVILRPSGIAVTGLVADESDTREVTTFKGEYTKRFSKELRLKLDHHIYWANQDDLNEYDVLSNTTVLTPSYYFKKASLSAPVGYNYTMVGGHDYLSSFSVSPLFNFMIGNSNMGQLFFKYQNKNFMGSATRHEKRDSNNYAGGAGWFWFFAGNKGFLNFRYELSKDDTQGRNWEYVGNKFTTTVLVPLLEKLKISASGAAFLQDFENTHTVFGKERDDETYTASCMLAYDLFKDAELQLRYTYVKSDSNIAVYDYDRNIYSGGVEYKF